MKPSNPVLLPDELLEEIFRDPDGPLTPLGKFVFYGKYSRWREDMNRREYWAETAQRAIEYNINLAIKHLEDSGSITDELREYHEQELLQFYDNMFNLRQFLSGRTLWTGGTSASYINPMSNFNCSFLVLDEWKKLGELIHLGMVGTGIGFRILYADIENLESLVIRNWDIDHEFITTKVKAQRVDESSINVTSDRALITIGDSKEGWRYAIDLFFDVLTGKHGKDIKTIAFNYDNIRLSGERLERFGGRAGGPETIKGMFDKFHKILNGRLDKDYPKVAPSGRIKPIHALDLANAIGKNIISGGVRSIAEIALLDPDDKETIEAKSNIFGKEQLNHRFVSNNSVYYEDRPTDEQFDWQFQTLEYNGEPCYVNAVVAKQRRDNFNGVNPCVEILLDDRGLCNLTTTNVMAFAKGGMLDVEGLEHSMRMSARAGLRMTLPKLELPEWDAIQQRDRLLGVSITGWQDAMDAIGMGDNKPFQERLLKNMRSWVRDSADKYAELLGVNKPLLATCVKPEGTISQLAGGVSSGLHVSHATNFLRRIRSASRDPISKAVFDLGWKMSAEFQDGSQHDEIKEFVQYVPWLDPNTAEGSDGDNLEPKRYEYFNNKLNVKFHCKTNGVRDIKNLLTMARAYYGNDKVGSVEVKDHHTKDGFATVKYQIINPGYDSIFGKSTKVVVDFPNSSPAKRTKNNFSAIDQLETYKMFLENYTEHNPSNTISVRPEEWGDVKQWVKDNWDSMLAVSFLTLFDAPYPLLPFEETTEDVVNELRDSMRDFDPDVLMKYDVGDDQEIVDGSCESGACPVR